MRLLYNCVLVIIGLPLIGAIITLIAHFLPVSRQSFNWPSHIYTVGALFLLIVLFSWVYRRRTRWLEKVGIYKSWSDFKAYVIENHGYPPVSEGEKREFLTWAGLSEEEPPADPRKAAENVYRRIKAEVSDESTQRSHIRSLAWYVRGWPRPEDPSLAGDSTELDR